MKILCLLPLFFPTKVLLERNLASLKSFGQYIKTEPGIEFKVVVGGWGNIKYRDKIIEVLKNDFSIVPTLSFAKENKGKAVTVNYLYKVAESLKFDSDFIFTMDSDIVFPKDGKLFERTMEAMFKIHTLTRKPMGMISFGYKENNPNWLHKFENRHDYKYLDYDETISWPERPHGIGGGCLLIKREVWNAVDGYRTMGVYAPEDAYLLIDIWQKGATIGVLETAKVLHENPPPNERYQAWKNATCRGQYTIKSYEDSFKLAEEFWNEEMKLEEKENEKN